MANVELFRLKTQEQLTGQIQDISDVLGELVTQPSRHNEAFSLSIEDMKERFPERYRIYVDTLRRNRVGSNPAPTSTKKMHALNALDEYVIRHYTDENNRTLKARQMTVFEDMRDFLEAGGSDGYIKLPTAAGKTVLFIELIEATGLQTLVVMPTKVLVDQTAEKFQEFAPAVEIGKVYSDAKEYGRRVTLTTYDSFMARVESGDLVPDHYSGGLLILDEAHRVLSRRRRHTVGLFRDSIRLGFTATPKYATNRSLKDLLNNEVHSMDIPEAIELGLLSPLSVYLAETDIDLSNIRIAADGDYDERDLDRAINITSRNIAAVDVYQQLFLGQKTVVYCVGIKHAEAIAKAFNHKGIPADFISGEQSRVEQQEKLKRYKSGEVSVICNANILIEGFDEPSATVCLNLRPTLSAVVAEQRGGRVLRIDPNNRNKHAIIVDFLGKDYSAGGMVGEHPPITFAQILEGAEIFKKADPYEGKAAGRYATHYPSIEISGIKVVTDAEEVMRVVREIRGITEMGWYSIIALSRRFRLPEEFVLEFFKPVRAVHPEYFEIRAHSGQQKEYMSPEASGILGNCLEPEQGRKNIQEGEFSIAYSSLANFKGRRQKVEAVAESVLEELMRQDLSFVKIRFAGSNPVIVADRERFTELMRKRGMEFKDRDQVEKGPDESRSIIDTESEIALTQDYVKGKFVGDTRKIFSISDDVLRDLSAAHPEVWRNGVSRAGMRIKILRKEFESLYVQLMQARGLELANTIAPIDKQHEVGITNDYLNSTFVGGSAKNRPISNSVLAQIVLEHPEVQRMGVTLTDKSKKGKKIVILKREFEEIYKQRMQERGVEMKGMLTPAPVDSSREVGITNFYNETIFVGNERTLRPISQVVLNEIAKTYPHAWRTVETPGRKKVVVLKKGFEMLYRYRMEQRGIRLR